MSKTCLACRFYSHRYNFCSKHKWVIGKHFDFAKHCEYYAWY